MFWGSPIAVGAVTAADAAVISFSLEITGSVTLEKIFDQCIPSYLFSVAEFQDVQAN